MAWSEEYKKTEEFKQRQKAYTKRYRERHREELKERIRKFDKTEKRKAWRKKHKLEHPELYAAKEKRYRERHPDRVKARRRKVHLNWLYGLTLDAYNILLEAQGGLCAICKGPETDKRKSYLCVDHCHKTGRIRGLLCSNCNKGIGNLQESPSFLRQAADYLEKGE